MEFLRKHSGRCRGADYLCEDTFCCDCSRFAVWPVRVWGAMPSVDAAIKLIIEVFGLGLIWLMCAIQGRMLQEKRRYQQNGPFYTVTPPIFQYPHVRLFMTCVAVHLTAQLTAFLDRGAVNKAIVSGDKMSKIISLAFISFAIACVVVHIVLGILHTLIGRGDSAVMTKALYGIYTLAIFGMIGAYAYTSLIA